MTNPLIRIHNLETNEIIDREMNDDELEQYELDKAEEKKKANELKAKLKARQELLDKLGITEEEAKLLLG